MKRTIGQSILAVEQNLGSVFTKEDVLELLNNIEQETNLSDEQKESIISDIVQNLEYAEDNIIDKDSVRLDIDSNNYITIERVDIDFDVIKHAVRDVILNLE
jgi:outer membrane PBP1 activator LpoA protein